MTASKEEGRRGEIARWMRLVDAGTRVLPANEYFIYTTTRCVSPCDLGSYTPKNSKLICKLVPGYFVPEKHPSHQLRHVLAGTENATWEHSVWFLCSSSAPLFRRSPSQLQTVEYSSLRLLHRRRRAPSPVLQVHPVKGVLTRPDAAAVKLEAPLLAVATQIPLERRLRAPAQHRTTHRLPRANDDIHPTVRVVVLGREARRLGSGLLPYHKGFVKRIKARTGRSCTFVARRCLATF